jgi:hypothetical protein
MMTHKSVKETVSLRDLSLRVGYLLLLLTGEPARRSRDHQLSWQRLKVVIAVSMIQLNNRKKIAVMQMKHL